MPYTINKINNSYELRLKKNNKLLGTHNTEEEAKKQIKAIEINKHKKKFMFWDLIEADNKKYKYTIIFKNIHNNKYKKISFGASGYGDYIIYNQTTTRKEADKHKKNYIKRHKIREDWTNPFKKGTLSRYILWNKPDLIDSLINYVNKFNLK